VSIDGAAPIDEMEAYLRNTDPASNAGIPGLALPAGLVDARLPVGLELDGPVGADRRLLAIGLAFEAILGTLPAPEI
jgi:mandelamide amidase